jgi:hemolysin III
LLVNLRGPWGWSLFGVIWGIALAGIVLKFWFVDHFQILSTTVYLLMGWLAVIAARPILVLVPTTGLVWLAAGGLLYTVGVAFFASKRIPYHHVIWHVFVLGGSTCHYFAVLYSVVLRSKA